MGDGGDDWVTIHFLESSPLNHNENKHLRQW